MSDADLLNPPVIEWPGTAFAFGPCDLEVELLFQSAQERWAANRLEAARGGVSAAVYDVLANKLMEQIAANKFAFGSPLSWQFLFSPAGTAEYLSLLSGKAGRKGGPATPRALSLAIRADPDAARRVWDRVVERDFPNPPPEAEPPASGPTETTTPSTTGSSSSLAAAPG